MKRRAFIQGVGAVAVAAIAPRVKADEWANIVTVGKKPEGDFFYQGSSSMSSVDAKGYTPLQLYDYMHHMFRDTDEKEFKFPLREVPDIKFTGTSIIIK